MRSEWPLVPVAECCSLIVDCVNKTAPVVDYETPYRMIRTTNVRGGFIDLADCRFVDEATFRTWTRRASLLDGDVVLTREAPIGEVGLVRGNRTIFLGQRLMQYRANRTVLDPRFLCYAFLSPQLQHQFGAHEGSGSVVSHIRVGDCSEFKIPLPPLSKQREIADLLAALDERRLLLRQTNTTLESIAQALFKSWFIDFDPVRAKQAGREPEGMDAATAALFPAEFEESALGLIPKGWRCGCLGDVLTQRVSRTKPSEVTAALPYVPIECITAKSVFLRDSLSGEQAQSSLTLFKEGDVLFGAMRPYFHKVCIAPFDGLTRTTAFVLQPKAEHGAFALFAAFDDSTIEFATTHSEGSTIPYAKWSGSLERKPLVLPPGELAAVFEALVAPLMKSGVQNTRRAQTLADVRDELLPRLMSGKLRLPEAQEQLEDALA